MVRLLRATVAFSAPLAAASPIDAQYAQNLTVYHINPLHLGALPISMDSGDAWGDIFFDFRSKVFPFECEMGRDRNPFDCTNPEVIADDLVVTRLVLEVDSRYGAYGRCNICINGTDNHGIHGCTDGDYVCQCGSSRTPQICGGAVGAENVTANHFGWGTCKNTSEAQGDAWRCWQANVVNKLQGADGGMWYSTTAEGYCGDGSQPAPANCTWRVAELTKIVNKTCNDQNVYHALENLDESSKECFSSCEDSEFGSGRNISSPCWVECFYAALLGPNASQPDGGRGGISQTKILEAWTRAFKSEDPKYGGCPAIPQPPQPPLPTPVPTPPPTPVPEWGRRRRTHPSPTPGPTPTPAPTPGGRTYTKHTGYDCYKGYGGTPMDANDTAISKKTVAQCEAICDATAGCAAITRDYTTVGDCWLRSAVQLKKCDRSVRQWDTYTATASPTPAPTPSPAPKCSSHLDQQSCEGSGCHWCAKGTSLTKKCHSSCPGSVSV